MKKSRKLRDYIIRSNILAVLLPILMVGLLVVSIIIYYNEKEMQQKNHIITSTIAQRISQMLDKPIADLKEIADIMDRQILSTDKTMEYLETVVTHADYLEGLEIIDENGRVRYMAPFDQHLLGISRVNQAYYQIANRQEKAYFSTSFISQQTGSPALTVAMKHESKVLVAYLNLEQISLLSSQLSESYGNNMLVAITDRRGVYISYKELEKVYQREMDPNIQMIREGIQEKDFYTGKHRDHWITAYPVENANWYTIVYQSVDTLYGTVKRIVFVGFLVMLIFFVLSASITRRNLRKITHSFQELLAQTKEIARGNYERRVQTDSFEEFHQLAESFNIMVDKIESRNRRLRDLAYFDPVTKLPNASYVHDFLGKMLLKHQEANKKLAVIYFDLDHFKRINDTYGHTFGDEVLTQVGERLLAEENQSGTVARMSGDDFVCVLPEIKDLETVLEKINSLRKKFALPISSRDTEVYLNISFGIALYPEHGDTVGILLQHADTATSASKKEGRNKYTFFHESMKLDLRRKMDLEKGMRRALENQEMSLCYQPQVFAKTLEDRGVEALLRWHHPVFGSVSPYEFIQVAEESGQILAIGEWVLSKACEKLASFNGRLSHKLTMSVNVSTLQLRSRGFVDMVKKYVNKYKINPSLLELEMTESVFIHSFDEAVTILNELRGIGVKISLDDFGTGFSSLSYLRHLPINTLKIDKAFVQGMETDKDTEVMIDSVITMAHNMNLDVIAEGVENEGQLQAMEHFDCDMVQGYYISRPLTEEMLGKYFEKKNDENS
ncbi:bifunctional diguanylate cyclase/phosphodiesterase [Tindallia californiensis]|uniref:Diguanylate cyclase (GGDEF) domain-containing protein n=1 Tax=Tindallia californiensis TaxID=159292 RepID=A0A1H3LB12_9FIRM|nr:EAL domain-containing protein [Tindallia californiensis]SDY61500.1 diguanylate cyclase (GGDEF) domain-containing protein [Tindallia californiensis]